MSVDYSIIKPPFDSLTGQSHVASYLTQAIESRMISHAYLFAGPIGAGKNEAARALAKAIVCRLGGCGHCDDCMRAARKTHPDVAVIEPEGVNGYVAEQVRDLIHDTNLAPARAQAKVYILTRADLLSGAPANAFLKTLEEPPTRVVFILLARTRESVMDTITSRCQVIAFRSIPEVEAAMLLQDLTQVNQKDARIAIAACGGSAYKAREFLSSQVQRNLRVKVLEIIEQLVFYDPQDILDASRELLVYLKTPLDELKIEQERLLLEGSDYLTKGALSALELAHKRQISAKERENITQVLHVLRSWLRDCMMLLLDRSEDMVNVDFAHNVKNTAKTATVTAVTKAILAVDTAEQQILYNVSVQSAIEAMLFKCQRVLKGSN